MHLKLKLKGCSAMLILLQVATKKGRFGQLSSGDWEQAASSVPTRSVCSGLSSVSVWVLVLVSVLVWVCSGLSSDSVSVSSESNSVLLSSDSNFVSVN